MLDEGPHLSKVRLHANNLELVQATDSVNVIRWDLPCWLAPFPGKARVKGPGSP